jgi:23S rRNA pseudouridine1911/1915/1917 synthase
VGLVHRLDRPVSGVLLLARTSKGAERLSRQFREGTVKKTYWALVEGNWPDEPGVWTDRLEKRRGANRSRTVDGPGKEASLAYRVLTQSRGQTLFELQPRTGRGHQLRVQLASRGLPIVGDIKYGARGPIPALDGGNRIALHARSLAFLHPTRAEEIEVTAPVPADWPGPSPPC